MARIDTTFAELKSKNQPALITFITAGDPNLETTVPLMHALVSAGADIVELGVPFSDPMADGPVIQQASERALSQGVGTNDVLNLVREFRKDNDTTPIVLMGYLNPIEIMGYESFSAALAEAGADGIIVVDMPPEEGAELSDILRQHNISQVFLLAPTSTADRIQLICKQASGFIYYVSLRGVTGASHVDAAEVESRLDVIKSASKVPVGVGFGIDSPAAAADIARFADAVIVGSALVRIVADNATDLDQLIDKATAFIESLSNAVKHARDVESIAT
ncbi:MAG: tryptophan synthase subunit alpha [Arenicellales bacterium]|nr:tryptophan synthase subunit alpha [Arenicellales bacterium]